jgi:protein-L-isoaspartate(D-aspartate) O-methyltransferase
MQEEERTRAADAFAEERSRLLAQVAADTRDTACCTGRPRLSERVTSAMATVPRHLFVPKDEIGLAYANRPLSIGYGQTISQPYIVAIMSELLDLAPADRVLEIGTGCGYQTAVLAELAGQVFSIELVKALAADAAERLRRLGYETVRLRCGDGYRGWPEEAPFDAIIVTAAPERVPDGLVRQLKPGGRLVVPVGSAGGTQALLRCVKEDDGRLAAENKLSVAFVPMVPAPATPPEVTRT